MLIVFIFAFHNISTLLSSSNGALQWMQLKSQYGTMGQRGVIIRTPLTCCILHPIKELKAEAVLLFGRPDIWTCIPQAQEPLAIPVWAELATDTNARAVVSHTSLVVWDSFSLPASLPKQTLSMATKDSANSPLK